MYKIPNNSLEISILSKGIEHFPQTAHGQLSHSRPTSEDLRSWRHMAQPTQSQKAPGFPGSRCPGDCPYLCREASLLLSFQPTALEQQIGEPEDQNLQKFLFWQDFLPKFLLSSRNMNFGFIHKFCIIDLEHVLITLSTSTCSCSWANSKCCIPSKKCK